MRLEWTNSWIVECFASKSRPRLQYNYYFCAEFVEEITIVHYITLVMALGALLRVYFMRLLPFLLS